MFRWRNRLKEEGGYTIIEAMVVTSVFAIIIGAAISLTQMAYWMDRQAEDGFEAQNEGRRVLSQVVNYLRPAQNINSNEVPLVHALSDGTVVDVRADTERDGTPEIARFELDQDGERIVLYLDHQTAGQYNYQVADESYLTHYGTGTAGDPSQNFDEEIEIAHKIVNTPETSWGPQTPATDPQVDFRLFTFYGDDFDVPLDTENLAKWENYIRGVKIWIWSDIQPTEIPSPFGIQTNVHLRNIQGE